MIGTTADGYAEVRCSDLLAAGPTVFLAFGQSIASNFNQTPRTPHHASYSIDQGRCFEARDPLPGADGTRGSMWSWLADELDPVRMPYTAFVTIGVGSSSIAQWDVGGSLHPRLTNAVAATRQVGFEIAYVLWHQGSADRATSPDEYQSRFRSMIAALANYGLRPGPAAGQAKVVIAEHTSCHSPPVPALAAAQRGLVDPANGFFAGANTDALQGDNRFDGCHLSTLGQQRAARLWRSSIEAAADYVLPRP